MYLYFNYCSFLLQGTFSLILEAWHDNNSTSSRSGKFLTLSLKTHLHTYRYFYSTRIASWSVFVLMVMISV